MDRVTAPRQSGAVEPRFEETFTKVYGFGLVEYETIAFIDADIVFLQNADEVMDLEIPEGTVAACHACSCNPNKDDAFPKDW